VQCSKNRVEIKGEVSGTANTLMLLSQPAILQNHYQTPLKQID
jgi:hypothetical protein